VEEVSPFEPTVFGAIRRHWQLVVAPVVLAVFLVGAYSATSATAYRATGSLTVTDPRGPGLLGGQERTDPERYVSDQLAVFDSATFGERGSALGAEQRPPLVRSPQWFIDHTTAGASAQVSNLVSVSFSSESRSEAMTGLRVAVAAYQDMIANATGEQARTVEEQLDAAVTALDEQIALLSADPDANAAELQQLRENRAQLAARSEQVAGEALHPSSGVTLALLPSDASSNARAELLRRLILAVAVGTLVGVALAYARAYRNRVFVAAHDPELVLRCPLLIDVSKGTAAQQPETYAVATSLLRGLAPIGDSDMSLTIVTAESAPTVECVASQLADAFAREGLGVVLLDTAGTSLMAPAPEDQTLWHPWQTAPPAEPGTVVRTGLTDARDIESSIRTLEDNFDVVVVSAPSFLTSVLAPKLVSATRNAIVVVNDRSSVTVYEELSRRLRLADIAPLAYVYCPRESRMRAFVDAFGRALRGRPSHDDGESNVNEPGVTPAEETPVLARHDDDDDAEIADVETRKASGWGS
jgi:hypothetical protein